MDLPGLIHDFLLVFLGLGLILGGLGVVLLFSVLGNGPACMYIWRDN